MKQNRKLFVALCVDEIFMVATNKMVLVNFKEQLQMLFYSKYFYDVMEYLSIEFCETEFAYTLSQKKFSWKTLKEFDFHGTLGFER